MTPVDLAQVFLCLTVVAAFATFAMIREAPDRWATLLFALLTGGVAALAYRFHLCAIGLCQ